MLYRRACAKDSYLSFQNESNLKSLLRSTTSRRVFGQSFLSRPQLLG